ncbi:MAG: ribosome maturation factor RimM [Litorivicinaceae bacterium]
MSDRLVVGRIRSPYGIQGWTWVESFTDDPETLFSWTPWVLSRTADRTSGRPALNELSASPVEWARREKGFVVRLDIAPDRTAVEALTQCLIYTEAERLPSLASDEFYWRDLEGCRCSTLSEIDLGVVKMVMATGANDVLVIAGDAQSLDRRERLVPFHRDYVPVVDVVGRRIIVDWDPEF